jgi:hypothetical protein
MPVPLPVFSSNARKPGIGRPSDPGPVRSHAAQQVSDVAGRQVQKAKRRPPAIPAPDHRPHRDLISDRRPRRSELFEQSGRRHAVTARASVPSAFTTQMSTSGSSVPAAPTANGGGVVFAGLGALVPLRRERAAPRSPSGTARAPIDERCEVVRSQRVRPSSRTSIRGPRSDWRRVGGGSAPANPRGSCDRLRKTLGGV